MGPRVVRGQFQRPPTSLLVPAFLTTKAVGRGSGQGLAIPRSIVEEIHGGSLTFRSEVGTGTTFVVRLPITAKRGAGTP
jgi:signal transduction histidine kinase